MLGAGTQTRGVPIKCETFRALRRSSVQGTVHGRPIVPQKHAAKITEVGVAIVPFRAARSASDLRSTVRREVSATGRLSVEARPSANSVGRQVRFGEFVRPHRNPLDREVRSERSLGGCASGQNTGSGPRHSGRTSLRDIRRIGDLAFRWAGRPEGGQSFESAFKRRRRAELDATVAGIFGKADHSAGQADPRCRFVPAAREGECVAALTDTGDSRATIPPSRAASEEDTTVRSHGGS